MIIIGEKINGSIPSMGKAIGERNEAYIREIARKQAEAGADLIDCCASVNENEIETLEWLIDLIQSETDLPIAVDSPDPEAIAAVMDRCRRPGMVNSVSGEGRKTEILFPRIAGTEWQVLALLCDDDGIPDTAEGRIRVLDRIMAEADRYGVAHDRIHIDPMVEMLCTMEDGMSLLREVMRYTRETYPDVHISGAVSNISYNLPYRKIVNLAYTVMAVAEGMDSAVLDPLNRDLRGAIYAAEALMGQDDYCLEYIGAYREGLFGPTGA